mgnify:CR=1 FL=1
MKVTVQTKIYETYNNLGDTNFSSGMYVLGSISCCALLIEQKMIINWKKYYTDSVFKGVISIKVFLFSNDTSI